MPLKSDYNHIICIMEGETKNIRFVLKIYRFVLRLLNISFCGLYFIYSNLYPGKAIPGLPSCSLYPLKEKGRGKIKHAILFFPEIFCLREIKHVILHCNK